MFDLPSRAIITKDRVRIGYTFHSEGGLILTGSREGSGNECQGEEANDVHSGAECLKMGGWVSSLVLGCFYMKKHPPTLSHRIFCCT